jgi:chromosome segregation ATPase
VQNHQAESEQGMTAESSLPAAHQQASKTMEDELRARLEALTQQIQQDQERVGQMERELATLQHEQANHAETNPDLAADYTPAIETLARMIATERGAIASQEAQCQALRERLG